VGNEEAELGVSLSPGRALSRSEAQRWSGGSASAPNRRRWLIAIVAAMSIAALAIAVVVGIAPMAASIAVALMVPAAVIDIEQRRLPDGWTIAAMVSLTTALAMAAAFGDSTSAAPSVGTSIGGLLGGSLAMAVPVLAVHLVSPSAMGFGDVKAAAVLGAAVGTIDWRLGAVALCLAALSGGAAGVLGRRRTIAFGPFLVFGAWASVLANDPILGALFTGTSTS